MPILRRTAAAATALAAALAAPASEPVQEPSSKPWSEWRSLRLDARSVPLLSGSVRMTRQRAHGDVTLETITQARFLGARIAQSETRSVLDGDSGRPRRSEAVSKRKRGRRFVFRKDGYVSERLVPDGSGDEPLDRWAVSSREEFAYPRGEDGRPLPIYDYYGMLLELGRFDLDAPGDETTVWVATGKGPRQFRVSVAEVRTGEYRIRVAGSGERRTLPTRELLLRIEPSDDSDEGFLDMQGNTEIWVEADTKTLLRISGKVPKVPGQVHLGVDELGF